MIKILQLLSTLLIVLVGIGIAQAQEADKNYPFSITAPKNQPPKEQPTGQKNQGKSRRTKIFDENDTPSPKPPKSNGAKTSGSEAKTQTTPASVKTSGMRVINTRSYIRQEESSMSEFNYTVIYVEGDVQNQTGQLATDVSVQIQLQLQDDHPSIEAKIPVILPGKTVHFKENYSSNSPLRSISATVGRYKAVSTESKEAIPFWVDALYIEENPEEKIKIIRKFEKFKDVDTIPALIAKLGDIDVKVSAYARNTLEGFAKQKKLLESLETALFEGLSDPHPQVKRKIIEILGVIQADRVVYPIIALIASGNPDDLHAAKTALLSLGEKAVAPLLKLQGSAPVAKEMQWALNELGPAAVTGLVKSLSQRPEGIDAKKYQSMPPSDAIAELLTQIPEANSEERNQWIKFGRSVLGSVAPIEENSVVENTTPAQAAQVTQDNAPSVSSQSADTPIYLGIAIGLFVMVILGGMKFGI